MGNCMVNNVSLCTQRQCGFGLAAGFFIKDGQLIDL